jgi:MarC family membrane protein
VIQTLFDFPTYFKFFIGLFALVNPVGIIPVFISMTSYQTAAAGINQPDGQPVGGHHSADVAVSGRSILQIFGISIDSFRIAGGILVVTIAMSMISGKLGEDKQNKQEKSETAIRESIGVVPLALPLMAGPGQSVRLLSGERVTTGDHLWVFRRDCPFCLCCWGFSVWRPGWCACWADRH